jgi:hypothetical protein
MNSTVQERKQRQTEKKAEAMIAAKIMSKNKKRLRKKWTKFRNVYSGCLGYIFT